MLPRLSRRALLGLLLALPASARAAGGGKGDVYFKLNSINLEFWDEDGLFHMVNMELTVLFHEPPGAIDKKVADRIARTLSAMTWEEFNRGNPAATIKGLALDLVRKEPGGEKAVEVLIVKLMLR